MNDLRLPADLSDVVARLSLVRRFEGEAEAALYSILVTEEALRVVGDQLFAAFGLSEAEFHALMVLQDFAANKPETSLRQSEIAKLLFRHPTSAGQLIDRLGEGERHRGGGKLLVERSEDLADRRARIVRISKLGRKTMGRVRPAFLSLVRQAFSGLTTSQQIELIHLLALVRQGVKDARAALADKNTAQF